MTESINNLESKFFIGMVVPILEHGTPGGKRGKSCLSGKGAILSLDGNEPEKIECLEPGCKSSSVIIDKKTFRLEKQLLI